MDGLDGDADPGAVTHPLPEGVLVDRDAAVRMRDGVDLAVTVFRPEAEGRFPVVMCMTAYGKDFGPDGYSTLPKLRAAGMAVGRFEVSEATTWEGPDPGFWVPAGYAVVVADARGFYRSGGLPGIYGQQEALDYEDLIEWAGTQPWSTGAVGLNGVSYLAITQWLVASRTRPPHLKAIIPWEGTTDRRRDASCHGGIPETRFTQAWLHGSLLRGAGPAILERAPALLAEATAFELETIDVPALVCGSWSDPGLHTRGSFEGFTRISSARKWLFTHGRNKWEVYYSPEALGWQRAFLDRFLKDEPNGFDRRPRVRLEVRRTATEHSVRSERDWPLPGVRPTALYLHPPGHGLAMDAPAGSACVEYDALAGEVVAFEHRFATRQELTGSMALRLWVSTSEGDDLDLFVALRKLDRDGREVRFCGKDGARNGVVSLGWLRVSERGTDPVLSRPLRPYLHHQAPQPVRPGEVVPVDIEILPSSTLFERDETLRLEISGRDIFGHARFGHDAMVNQGRHSIHAGGLHDSHLLAPFASGAAG